LVVKENAGRDINQDRNSSIPLYLLSFYIKNIQYEKAESGLAGTGISRLWEAVE